MIPSLILAIENDDDREFMAQLYERYHRLMYKEIFQIVRSKYDTEDLIQSVLIKLIDRIPLLRCLEQRKRINYVAVSCKRAALNLVRDRTRAKEAPYEDYINAGGSTSDDHPIELRLFRQEEYKSLARVWPTLDDRTRTLLEGYYILGKSMDELGAELGIKPSSIRMALTRARDRAYRAIQLEMEKEE